MPESKGSEKEEKKNAFFLDPVGGTCLFLAALVIVATIMLIVASLPRTERITVTDMTWARSVDVCETRAVREEGWELPEGATLVSAEKRPYQYVRKMYQFRGTPVYADWYVYEIDRTVTAYTATEHGVKGADPVWPQPVLRDGQDTRNGQQSLSITTSDGKSYDVHSDVWDLLSPGDVAEVTIEHDGTITRATVVE